MSRFSPFETEYSDSIPGGGETEDRDEKQKPVEGYGIRVGVRIEKDPPHTQIKGRYGDDGHRHYIDPSHFAVCLPSLAGKHGNPEENQGDKPGDHMKNQK